MPFDSLLSWVDHSSLVLDYLWFGRYVSHFWWRALYNSSAMDWPYQLFSHCYYTCFYVSYSISLFHPNLITGSNLYFNLIRERLSGLGSTARDWLSWSGGRWRCRWPVARGRLWSGVLVLLTGVFLRLLGAHGVHQSLEIGDWTHCTLEHWG